MRGFGWACGAILAALLAFGANVQAQDRPTGRMRGLASADANGDGAITREEAHAARGTMFARLDTDGDGLLTDADREAHADRMKQRRGQRAEAMRQAMDTNHDGKISRAEFIAAPTPGFDRLDANHDGVIDAGDRAAARAMWAERRAQSAPEAPAQGQSR